MRYACCWIVIIELVLCCCDTSASTNFTLLFVLSPTGSSMLLCDSAVWCLVGAVQNRKWESVLAPWAGAPRRHALALSITFLTDRTHLQAPFLPSCPAILSLGLPLLAPCLCLSTGDREFSSERAKHFPGPSPSDRLLRQIKADFDPFRGLDRNNIFVSCSI